MDLLTNLAASLFMALFFLVSGAHKLRGLPAFRAAVEAYRLLPESLTGAASVLLAALELAIGLAMLVPVLRPWAAAAAAAVLGLYALAMGLNILRGRTQIDCGCALQARGTRLNGWLLVRNAALIGISLTVLVPIRPRPMLWLDYAQAFAVVLALGMLYVALEGVFANHALMKERGRSHA